jgi:hypothetical protein
MKIEPISETERQVLVKFAEKNGLDEQDYIAQVLRNHLKEQLVDVTNQESTQKLF